MTAADVTLSRTAASEAVEAIGWRYALDTLVTSVPTSSLNEAGRTAMTAIAACGGRAGEHLRLVDPAGQLPAVWFQQMDVPRPQRNPLHLDLTVAHDEADARVRAALDAGGVLVSDARARAFWILADAEGNEVCVCTWQDRDPA